MQFFIFLQTWPFSRTWPFLVFYGYSSYLSYRAATKEEIINSKTTVAALFFENVFGTKAERALSVIVALRWSYISDFFKVVSDISHS